MNYLIFHYIKLHIYSYSSIIQMLIFYVMICALFAVGVQSDLLSAVSSSVLWVCALLSLSVASNQVIVPELKSGVLEVLWLSPYSFLEIIIAKFLSFLIVFGSSLVIASFVSSLFFDLPASSVIIIIISLISGLPLSVAIFVFSASLAAGKQQAAMLSIVLSVPLLVPVIIFGGGFYQQFEVNINQAKVAIFALCGISLLFIPFLLWAASKALAVAIEEQ